MSPEETIASQASRRAPVLSSTRSTPAAGTGALETRITVPPPARNPRQGLSRLGVGVLAIVHHTPDVAKEHVVGLQQVGGAGEDRRCHGIGEELRLCRIKGCRQ
jgi:hypothetical protein